MRLVACLALIVVQLPGIGATADEAEGDGVAAPDPAAVKAQALAQAGEQATKGFDALRDADADAARAVDAAIAFARAKAGYEQAGEAPSAALMDAAIGWCRRTAPDLRERLGTVAGDDAADARAADGVLARKLPTDAAGECLARARKQLEAHPGQHLRNAIMLGAVVDGFPDTDSAGQAAPLLAKELAARLAQVQQEREAERARAQEAIAAARRERFKLPAPLAEGAASPMPDASTLAKATATVKKAYGEDFARRKDIEKRWVARKLRAEAAKDGGDAAQTCALLRESARLAADAKDYRQLLETLKLEATTFQGVDARARFTEALGKAGDPTALAVLTLLDRPDDPAANGIAGKYYALKLEAWSEGAALLANAADPALKALGEQELAAPSEPVEQKKLGNAWYELGKQDQPARAAAWGRAQYWYHLAEPRLGAIGKATIADAQAAIAKLLTIDLRSAIALKDPLMRGAWRIDGSTIAVEAGKPGDQLAIPLMPRGDYVFDCDFERLGSVGEVMFLLPLRDQSVNVFIFQNGMSIHRLDDRIARATEPTAKLAIKGRQHLTARVTQGADAIHILLQLDGRDALEWSGPGDVRLGNQPKAKPFQPGALGLGSWNAKIAFANPRLLMLSGTAVPLEDAGIAP